MESNKWIQLPPMHVARSHHASAVVSNKILVMGGFMLKSVECYNPANNKWSRRAQMLQPRSDFEAGTVNDFVYILEGALYLEPIEVKISIERYCYKTNKWELVWLVRLRIYIVLNLSFNSSVLIDEFCFGAGCTD